MNKSFTSRFQRWYQHPSIGLCRPATRGIWIDLMIHAASTGRIQGELFDLAVACRCTPRQMNAAIADMVRRNAMRVSRSGAIFLIEHVELAREQDARSKQLENSRHVGHRRRARMRDVENSLIRKEWEEIVSYFGSRCAYCNRFVKKPEIEHMVPICRGGAHSAANVVPACSKCNGCKGSLTPLEFICKAGMRNA